MSLAVSSHLSHKLFHRISFSIPRSILKFLCEKMPSGRTLCSVLWIVERFVTRHSDSVIYLVLSLIQITATIIQKVAFVHAIEWFKSIAYSKHWLDVARDNLDVLAATRRSHRRVDFSLSLMVGATEKSDINGNVTSSSWNVLWNVKQTQDPIASPTYFWLT